MSKIKDILQTHSVLFKKIILISSCFLLSLIIYVGITVVYAAWQEPSSAPPLDNASAPINVSSSTQTIVDSKKLKIKDDGTGMLSIQGNLKITGATGNVTLETTGGPLKATGGLIIEVRSNDPTLPESGRIWINTSP